MFDNPILFLPIYYILVNLLGYFSMYKDKKAAIENKYRTSERHLFSIALFGGALGSVLGMKKFRHKTKHWYFKIFMPLILICQIVLIAWFILVLTR